MLCASAASVGAEVLAAGPADGVGVLRSEAPSRNAGFAPACCARPIRDASLKARCGRWEMSKAGGRVSLPSASCRESSEASFRSAGGRRAAGAAWAWCAGPSTSASLGGAVPLAEIAAACSPAWSAPICLGARLHSGGARPAAGCTEGSPTPVTESATYSLGPESFGAASASPGPDALGICVSGTSAVPFPAGSRGVAASLPAGSAPREGRPPPPPPRASPCSGCTQSESGSSAAPSTCGMSSRGAPVLVLRRVALVA
mmetsp:Transcript_39501/g.93759  ORF Transcript_39501/g.93759 Transcript_39501/m.93759 type:complete len:258 (-) Transcript_39501:9-782(-)